MAVFVDAVGNVYIADTLNDRIRKVDPTGTIITVAGNGRGFGGDGGAATNARLNAPTDIFVDGSGRLYIVDQQNNRIRRVDATNIITTIAGNGNSAFSGDGGPATNAGLQLPTGVFVDASGNVYISDTGNNRIRKVDTSGTITTVAGNGSTGLAGDGGPATNANVWNPWDIFVDASGNIYLTDPFGGRIRKVGPAPPAPKISLSASSLTMGNTNTGSSSSKQFIISNTGNADLSVTSITVTGADASQFTVSQPTTATIAAGNSKTVTVTFAPTSAGTKSASLSIAHNASGSPSAVSLSGTAQAPTISVSTTSLALDNVNVGSVGTATFTIGNTGNAPLVVSSIAVSGTEAGQFTVSPTSFTVNAGASAQTVTVTFAPMSGGTKSATLTINSNDPVNPIKTVSLSGIGSTILLKASDPVLSLLTFKGSSPPAQTVVVSDSGNISMTVTPSIAGTDAGQFSVTPNTATTVAAGATQTFTVTFTPSPATGNNRFATLNLAHNATNRATPLFVSLVGDVSPNVPSGLIATTGNNQAILNWTANTESDLSHYVIYRSTTNNFTPTSADSIVRVNKPATTYPNTGLGAGIYYFKIAAVDSAGNKSAVSAQASATLAPVYSQSSSSLSFGSVKIGGTPGTQTFTVSNTGTATLVVSSIARVGTADTTMFTVSPPSFAVNAGATAQTVTATFTPTSPGSKAITLSITHNASGSPGSVSLSGIGVDVTAPAGPAGLTATAGNNQVSLSWVANTDTDLSYYVVYKSTTNNFTPAASDSIGRVDKPGTSYTSSGLSAGIYYFKIKAVDTAGNKSAESNQASATLAPVVSVSVATLNFGDVQTGQSKQLTFTVSNPGTAVLTVTGITVTGNDASMFTVSPTTFTVNSDAAAQTVTVTFAPPSSATEATRSASLSIAHNASNSPSTVPLTGNSKLQPPSVVVNPTTLSFGNVRVGQTGSQIFTITNSGQSPLTVSAVTSSDAVFTVSPTSFTVAAGVSQSDTVRFTPTTRGDKSVTITISHNAAGSPATVTVSGKGIAPILTLSATSLDFGDVQLNASKPQTLTISNTGDADLQVTSIAVRGPDAAQFTVSSTSLTVSAGQSAPVTVTFTPSSTGTKSDTLSIAHTAVGSPATVVLNGKGAGVSSITLSPPSLSFGNVRATTSKSMVFTVGNSGNVTLKVSSISVIGGDAAMFSVTPESLSVNPGEAAKTVTVTFRPPAGSQSATQKTASVSLIHNASGSPSLVSLTGTATAPAIAVSSASLAFDSVTVGQSKALTLTVSNTGTDTLFINRVSVSGADTSQFPIILTQVIPLYMILPSGSQPISVPFSPTSAGNKTSTLTLNHNPAPTATSTPVPLTGKGIVTQAGISVSVTSLTMDSTLVGGPPSQKTFKISNTGNAPLTVSSIARVGTADTTMFTVSPTAFTINVGDSARIVTIKFSPSSIGSKSATLSIAHNAAGGPVRVSVSGIGVVPDIDVLPLALNFGDVEVRQSKSLTLVIANRGNTLLSVTSITSSSEVFKATPTKLTLTSRDSQQVTVTFTPTTSGAQLDTLKIVSNDPDEQVVRVVVNGNGLPVGFDGREVEGPVSVDLDSTTENQGRKIRKGVKAGNKVWLQLFVTGAPAISGFSVRLEFDPLMLKINDTASSTSDFIPNKLSLPPVTLRLPGVLDFGAGNLVGATRSGDGLLGTVVFQVLGGFSQETRIVVTQVIFSLSGGRQEVKQQRAIALLTTTLPSPDFSGDGFVSFEDFFLFAAAFGTENSDFDLSGDGFVSFDDFFAFAAAFGKSVGK